MIAICYTKESLPWWFNSDFRHVFLSVYLPEWTYKATFRAFTLSISSIFSKLSTTLPLYFRSPLKHLLFILTAFLFAFGLYAQGEADIWYFGNTAGITFKNKLPAALINGKLNTAEGCSSISDSTGKLLFYTDGTLVYNKAHSLMLNGSGLYGSSTSTHSSIIVKQPESNRYYYIFTADAYGSSGNNKGVNYSVVDMNGDNGSGSIISTGTLYQNVSKRAKSMICTLFLFLGMCQNVAKCTITGFLTGYPFLIPTKG